MRSTRITQNSLVCRKKNVLFSNLDDELLAIDSQAGFCYSMNATAGRIWDLITTPISVNAICSQLLTEFEVDEELCQQEVLTLLHKLQESGLIQVQDGNDSTD